jgi:hypothetical protein
VAAGQASPTSVSKNTHAALTDAGHEFLDRIGYKGHSRHSPFYVA